MHDSKWVILTKQASNLFFQKTLRDRFVSNYLGTHILQDQVQDLIINRHVLHANDSGKESIVMIIAKYTTPKENDFYEYSAISWGYGNGSLPQKEDDL